MAKRSSFVLGILLACCASDLQARPISSEMLDRGKKGTALVEALNDQGPAIKVVTTGSAFCIDRSGLFITCASVVTATSGTVHVNVVIDAGKDSKRKLPATVLRRDLDLDLALLQVSGAAMPTPLELGSEAGLRELLQLYTFGYPSAAKGPAVGAGAGAGLPEVAVLQSRITALRKETGRLADIAFDKTINPGYFGGPILDESGRVVGVSVSAADNAAQTLAIPVGSLGDFLAAPNIVFDMPTIPFETRSQPVTWTVRVQPPTPVATLPQRLSVAVIVKSNRTRPRTYAAQSVGSGVFRAMVIPDPEVEVGVRDDATAKIRFGAINFSGYSAYLTDCDVNVGGKNFRLSDLAFLVGGASPHVRTRQGQVVHGEIRGLSAATRNDESEKPANIDLKDPIEVAISDYPKELTVVVEVKQDSKIVATLSQRKSVSSRAVAIAKSTASGTPNAPTVVAKAPSPPPMPRSSPVPEDKPTPGKTLAISGVPVGAGKDIRPPAVAIADARLTPGAGQAPFVLQLRGTISDVASGGAGRFLLLTLKNERKIAVFDVNAAAVVKLINLTSEHALVAAGARRLLILYPKERLFDRWDLVKLEREGGTRPSPIKRPVNRLVMGSDSAGPALAYSSSGGGLYGLSFIDLDSLAVLKVGSIGGNGSHARLSSSSDSFSSDCYDNEHVRVRASANGSLFGLWNPGVSGGTPATLSVHGHTITAAQPGGSSFGPLFPGPDGRTVFTGSGVRLDDQGRPLDHIDAADRLGVRPMLIPTPDPAFYLSVGGLPGAAFDPNVRLSSAPGNVTVTVHSAGDGSPLLTVHGLGEMTASGMPEDWYRDDFTAEKRFHVVPAASLLVTIPPTNDRLVLRQLDVRQALAAKGRESLTIISLPTVTAKAGSQLMHRIEARSRQLPINYTLAQAPRASKWTRKGS